jgi:uncharacterized membrane protein YphA (DoxX/SURF4 family)
MTLINDYAPLLLRIALVILFPFSGLDKIINEAGREHPLQAGDAGAVHHRRVRDARLHRDRLA